MQQVIRDASMHRSIDIFLGKYFSTFFLFLFLATGLLAEPLGVIVLPLDNKDDSILTTNEKKEAYNILVKALPRQQETLQQKEFEVIDRENMDKLLTEQKYEQLGLTKKAEAELLRDSDGIIVPKAIQESGSDGNFYYALQLKLIRRNSVAIYGSAKINKASFKDGVELSVKDLLHALYPDKYSDPHQKKENEDTETGKNNNNTEKNGNSSSTTNTDTAKENPKKLEKPKKGKPAPNQRLTATKFLLRSAVLPGWGQWEKQQHTKAYLFFGGTLLAGFMAYSYDSKYNSLKSELGSKESMVLVAPSGLDLILYSQVQNTRSQISSTAKTADTAFLLFAGLYLFNLADAFFSSSSATTSMNSNLLHTGFSSNMFRTTLGAYKESNYTVEYQWRF